jgi:hypothetical protein
MIYFILSINITKTYQNNKKLRMRQMQSYAFVFSKRNNHGHAIFNNNNNKKKRITYLLLNNWSYTRNKTWVKVKAILDVCWKLKAEGWFHYLTLVCKYNKKFSSTKIVRRPYIAKPLPKELFSFCTINDLHLPYPNILRHFPLS